MFVGTMFAVFGVLLLFRAVWCAGHSNSKHGRGFNASTSVAQRGPMPNALAVVYTPSPQVST